MGKVLKDVKVSDNVSDLKGRIAELERDFEKSQQNLTELKGHLRKLTSTAMAGVIINTGGTVIDVNDNFTTITGYTGDEIIGKDMVREFVAKEHHQIVRKSVSSGVDVHYEFNVTRKDGAIVPVECWGTEVVFNHKPARMTVICDISARKNVENDLKASEVRFKKLASVTNEGVVITDNGIAIDANEQALKMIGCRMDEIIGTNIVKQFVLPEYVPLAMERIRANSEEPYEILARTKNGEVFPTEVRGATIEYNGKPARVTVIRDLTQIKEAEKAISKKSDELLDLYNNSPCGYHTLDKNAVYTRINDTELKWLGFTREEVVGKMKVTDNMSEWGRENFQKRFPTFMTTGAHRNVRTEWKRKDGTLFPVMVNSSAVRDEHGNIIGTNTMAVDATDIHEAEERQKAAKEEAEKATVLKDKFITLVAHDLRSPIAGVKTVLQSLKKKSQSILPPELDEILEMSIKQVCRTLLLADELLDVSRMQAGKVSLSPRFRLAADYANAAVSSVSSIANEKGITVENALHPDLYLCGDHQLLASVFGNLMSNAVKFCRRGDSVKIFSPSNFEGVVVISDTGPGIDPRLLPNLFAHDVKTTTLGTNGEEGTGFGLPYCADFLKAHGGTIAVDSEHGKGTTFTIRLPYYQPTILLVDDDATARAAVRMFLDAHNFKIIEARDGLDGLDKAREIEPHLIISDIKMPNMDGYGLLAELKKDEKTRDIPVVLMTGNSLEKKATAITAGAADLIIKFPEEEELSATIKHFLEAGPVRREINA